jgi:hypothetical protein
MSQNASYRVAAASWNRTWPGDLGARMPEVVPSQILTYIKQAFPDLDEELPSQKQRVVVNDASWACGPCLWLPSTNGTSRPAVSSRPEG